MKAYCIVVIIVLFGTFRSKFYLLLFITLFRFNNLSSRVLFGIIIFQYKYHKFNSYKHYYKRERTSKGYRTYIWEQAYSCYLRWCNHMVEPKNLYRSTKFKVGLSLTGLPLYSTLLAGLKQIIQKSRKG